MKVNRTRASMIATLSSLKISITALSFCWRNDTPIFCHLLSSSPNQFVPEIISLLPFSSGLVRYTLLFIFFKEVISLIGSFDKCHNSVFNALIIGEIFSLGYVIADQSAVNAFEHPPKYSSVFN